MRREPQSEMDFSFCLLGACGGGVSLSRQTQVGEQRRIHSLTMAHAFDGSHSTAWSSAAAVGVAFVIYPSRCFANPEHPLPQRRSRCLLPRGLGGDTCFVYGS
jgi:hypothetical protein